MIPQFIIFLIAYASLTISLVPFSRCDPTTTPAGLTLHLHDTESSPLSPFYDPVLTPSKRLTNVIRRSLNNKNMFSTTQSLEPTDLAPVITNSQGSYFLNYSIGTPPKPVQGYVSTGSDLIWTQCSDISGSKTYEPIKCQTNDQCDPYLPGLTSCSTRDDTCQYNMILGDETTSMGGLSKENIMLPSSNGEEHVLVEMVFGCEQKEQRLGYVGLGRGNASLLTQLKQSEFSYCLVTVSDDPSLSTSKLNFGDNAKVPGGLSIPLVTTGQSSSFYYVNLMGISNGEELLPYDGNMILNTRTTVSLFPEKFYTMLKNAVLNQTNVQPYTDDDLPGLQCFKTSNDNEFPKVTVHLEGGDLKLDHDNMFARLNDTDVCLAAAEGTGEALYGSLAMSNFLVGVDLGANQVKFLKTDCTKH